MLASPTRPFADRRDAGRALGERLRSERFEDPVVLGLGRGGMPVAAEVARALGAPLDVLVVRKLGAPGNPELGIGAIAEGGVWVLNEPIVAHLLLSAEELKAAADRARSELEVRLRRYRRGRPPLELTGRTAIVVDDGLATGGTARAALRAVRARSPRRLVLAVPVGAAETVQRLRREADEIICLREPEALWAVGAWYAHFDATGDAEVTALLDGAPLDADDPPAQAAIDRTIEIPGAGIVGDLVVPAGARALVAFAHGSGSSRFSPRNRKVARALQERRLGTLLLDLLRRSEEHDRRNVFDIELLAARLEAALGWVRREPDLDGLPIGLFGASTGAAAALAAAARLGGEVGAVVSRGGRPDLAGPALPAVRAPVLLIVGGDDDVVLELNRRARARMHAPCELAIIPGATHLFEEPGALEEVAALSGDWFERHLAH